MTVTMQIIEFNQFLYKDCQFLPTVCCFCLRNQPLFAIPLIPHLSNILRKFDLSCRMFYLNLEVIPNIFIFYLVLYAHPSENQLMLY